MVMAIFKIYQPLLQCIKDYKDVGKYLKFQTQVISSNVSIQNYNSLLKKSHLKLKVNQGLRSSLLLYKEAL